MSGPDRKEPPAIMAEGSLSVRPADGRNPAADPSVAPGAIVVNVATLSRILLGAVLGLPEHAPVGRWASELLRQIEDRGWTAKSVADSGATGFGLQIHPTYRETAQRTVGDAPSKALDGPKRYRYTDRPSLDEYALLATLVHRTTYGDTVADSDRSGVDSLTRAEYTRLVRAYDCSADGGAQ